MKNFNYILFFLLTINQLPSFGQSETQKDVKDVSREITKKIPLEKQFLRANKLYVSPMPVVGYAPANGFILGAALSLTGIVQDTATTKPSSGLVNFSITSKSQMIFQIRSKIFLPHNKWFLQGDWRFLIFTQPTYGLGINDMNSAYNIIDFNSPSLKTAASAQPMQFNYIRFYETVVRKIGKHTFAGAGLAIDHHFSINDENLVLDSVNRNLTSHYLYSIKRGFNTKHYTTSGFSINFVSDTRDNIINAYKGSYAGISLRFNPHLFGSSQQSSMLDFDFRKYISLSELKPSKVLAFWCLGQFVTSGNVPYLALPSIGWDTYNRTGRGYIQGRFRGLQMLYLESEYRFPITTNGLLGGTTFINSTFMSSDTQELLTQPAFGLGAGLRLKMDKLSRTNLTVDYGIGIDQSSGIYFNLQEAF